MRKLLLLAAVCFALNASAQQNWQFYKNHCPSLDSHDWMMNMRYDDPFSYAQNYQPNMSVKESRKVRKKLRKARKGRKKLAKTNFQLVPNRKNLTITAYLDAEDQSSYHIKLLTRKGKVIKSFTHLSPKTVQKIQMLQLLPGKYHLNLYAGIERRLMSTYNVNRY